MSHLRTQLAPAERNPVSKPLSRVGAFTCQAVSHQQNENALLRCCFWREPSESGELRRGTTKCLEEFPGTGPLEVPGSYLLLICSGNLSFLMNDLASTKAGPRWPPMFNKFAQPVKSGLNSTLSQM